MLHSFNFLILEDDDACAGSQWQCFTGNECIWAKNHCDGVADCKDKSDEFGCEWSPREVEVNYL